MKYTKRRLNGVSVHVATPAVMAKCSGLSSHSVTVAAACSDKGVRLAHKMQIGPCIPV